MIRRLRGLDQCAACERWGLQGVRVTLMPVCLTPSFFLTLFLFFFTLICTCGLTCGERILTSPSPPCLAVQEAREQDGGRL